MKRFTVMMFWAVFGFITLNIQAAVPLLLNYQGTVKHTSGSTVEGNGYFKFAIVDSTGANSYWSNDGTSAAGSEPSVSVTIPVSNSLFSVKLGDTTTTGTMNALTSAVFDNAAVYLRVWFSVDDVTYEMLTPDTQIVSAGFSIKAAKADSATTATTATSAQNLVCTGCVSLSELDFVPSGAGWTVSGNNMYSAVSGNVGVGTTTPSNKFEVSVPTVGYLNIKSEATGSPFGLRLESPARLWYLLHSGGTVEAGSIGLYDSTAGQYRLYIGTSGNVGIGTTAPAGKLDVNGAIYQRGGVLHADYVFQPKYHLESIDDHAKFMWKEKHLKAIPKAVTDDQGREVVEVGAHRKGIVEELEKAHIYIEQLNDHIKALEERLAKLEKKDQ